MATGVRSALIVASAVYEDPGLRELRAPAHDAEALAKVLENPQIGAFEVRTLLNEPAHIINRAVEDFFGDRSPNDLLLLHISCHGVKDEAGELHFATTNTELKRLASTSVAADFVNRLMTRSRSRRIVLLLDCCYAGAFERGMTARAGSEVGIEEQFGGRGRAVVTASSAMEYAFEGEALADTSALTASVFTTALVEGLQSGDADKDQDGIVALDELYDYVYTRVRDTTPNQTPSKWTFGLQGELFMARRARPVTTPTPLSDELQQALENPLAGVRAVAVQELTRLLHGPHAGLTLAARFALERLTEDDSRMVAAEASAALSASTRSATAEPEPPTSGAGVDPNEASPRPTVTPTPAGGAAAWRSAGETVSPTSGPEHDGEHAASDDVLRLAGQLALVAAALLLGGLLPDFVDEQSIRTVEPELAVYVVSMTLLASGAGAATLWRRRARMPDAAFLLGAGIASTWGLVGLTSSMIWQPHAMRGGFWLTLAGHGILAASAGVAALALARASEIRFVLRLPGPATEPLRWLVLVLGLVAAGALVFHDMNTWHFVGETSQRWRVDAAVWATAMTVVVPVSAAVASPRRCAAALLAGWSGGTATVFVYYYLLLHHLRIEAGWELGGSPILVFGVTLLALLLATAMLARPDYR
jgi:hypothetical protein